jgi:hypothetical protein
MGEPVSFKIILTWIFGLFEIMMNFQEAKSGVNFARAWMSESL